MNGERRELEFKKVERNKRARKTREKNVGWSGKKKIKTATINRIGKAK